jgi:hypothetical protein
MRLLELMSEADREKFLALQADKALWLKAHDLLKLNRFQIDKELDKMSESDALDMRKRLNTVVKNRKVNRASNSQRS